MLVPQPDHQHIRSASLEGPFDRQRSCTPAAEPNHCSRKRVLPTSANANPWKTRRELVIELSQWAGHDRDDARGTQKASFGTDGLRRSAGEEGRQHKVCPSRRSSLTRFHAVTPPHDVANLLLYLGTTHMARTPGRCMWRGTKGKPTGNWKQCCMGFEPWCTRGAALSPTNSP